MKKLMSLVLSLILLISSIPVIYASASEVEIPEGFTGVYNIEDLYSIRYALDKNYILMADIDMTEDTAPGGDWDNGYGWAPIGEDSTIPFTGIFDGNGHTIKGMQIIGIRTNYAGLFGYIEDGEIKNLKLNDIKITTANNTTYVGGFAGYAIDTTLSCCKVTGVITHNSVVKNSYTGGLVSYINGKSILTKCVNCAEIYGNNRTSETTICYVGGLVGFSTDASTISLSYNTANLTASGTTSGSTNWYYGEAFGGGIVGKNDAEAIVNCYNIGEINVKGNWPKTGGIASQGKADSCINLGAITSEGGEKSAIANGMITNCYYLRGTADFGKHNTTDTATTAVALSAAQMKLKAVFGLLDFENVWFLDTSKGINHPQLIANPESEYEHTHDYKTEVIAPTCTEKGYTSHTCTVCGDSFKDTYVDALGHDFGEWTETKAATCTEKGEETRYCSRCDVTETREINANGHTYKDVVTAPTCTAKGYTTHNCSECDDSYVDTYVNALGHNFGDWKVTKPATCTAKGEEKRYCSRCDATETRDVNAKGHSYNDVVTAPTCTEKGYTTHTCSACHDSSVDSYVDALGHDYKAVVTKPTCTEQGYTTYTCSRCNDSYKADYVPAKGHTDGEWKVTKQPTLTSEGTKTLYCSVCGKVIRTESIPKLTQGRVYSVKIDDISLNYKKSTTLKPSIQADSGVKYTVKYESSNAKVATVDQNGNVTATKRGSGSATITCIVTDQYGNVVKDTCKVNVSLTFGQKIIVYILFGWIWY